jgi:gamma-glutamyl-gamma-aminobutyrate hydrolase PuuD
MLLGITQRVVVNAAYPERRDALSQEWAPFLSACGVSFVPLPNHVDAVRALLAALPLTGFILSGGNDVMAYGGDAPERDAVEEYLLNHTQTSSQPVLGVCRGFQMMQVFSGGKLEKRDGHVACRHDVSGAIAHPVNSFHQYAVANLADGFDVLARAPDGTVEAARHRNFNWTGIMWHPEREAAADPADIALVKGVFKL